jgi:DNA (cytosine-5)-methyltransferase 1
MKFIDLFCGMGAFTQALRQEGHECVFACDSDKGARKIYEKNYGLAPEKDIRHILDSDIPAFDILCAGLPFELGEMPLFQEIIRILKQHQPMYAFIENVKNLCVHDEGRTLLTILDMLDDTGYYVKWNVLNAIDFGLPQCRERVFFVCYRKDVPCQFQFSMLEASSKAHTPPTIPAVRDIIDPDVEMDLTEKITSTCEIRKVDRKPRALGTKPYMLAELICYATGKGGGQGQRVYSIDYPGITVCSVSGGIGGSSGLYDVHGKIRTLTAKEVLRMFGFPDDFVYTCSDRRLITYMGSSTCVPIIRALVSQVCPAVPSGLSSLSSSSCLHT